VGLVISDTVNFLLLVVLSRWSMLRRNRAQRCFSSLSLGAPRTGSR
jgi:hypothetical protein